MSQIIREEPTSTGKAYHSTPVNALQRGVENERASRHHGIQAYPFIDDDDTPRAPTGPWRITQQPRPREPPYRARSNAISYQYPVKGYSGEPRSPTKPGREPPSPYRASSNAISHQVVPIRGMNNKPRTPTKRGRTPAASGPRLPRDNPSTAAGAAASDSNQLTPAESRILWADLEELRMVRKEDGTYERVPTPSIPSSSNQNDDQTSSCVPVLIAAPVDEDDKDEIVPCASAAYNPSDEPFHPKRVAKHPSASQYKEVWGRNTQPEVFGWTEQHFILGPTDKDVCIATNPLGHGSLGVVEEVRRIDGQFPTLVRKRISLPVQKRKAAAYLKIVQEEARILRSLVHPHIVTLIGSYEDMKQSKRPSYCLLMSPVGEGDLETFLTDVGEHEVAEFSIRSRDCIRNWMGCLASALDYMHASGIRHQDIKPSNIIYKGDQIFFTDFSSSSSFNVGHTTSTENPARSTPMYGAPEVTFDRGRHGCATDIFSLGCVFADMLSVIEGRTVSDLQDHLRNDENAATTGTRPLSRSLSYSEKVPAIKDWFAESHVFNAHVSQMLHPDRKMRPTAGEVLEAFLLNMLCDASCSCLRVGVPQRKLEAFSVVQSFVES